MRGPPSSLDSLLESPSPELRDLLTFVGENLDDDDIPHRMKLSEPIIRGFRRECARLVDGMQVLILLGIHFH
ncbi:hypothetical protein CVT26_008238 [Gymnopilus dilepis]|uniref:Uncharacterized protein n=1 Tax=Gymnopilus dilepis TaxID=231916 RepID=A0A409X8T9_9AGAR|nr:hypothetical protein CVT26_008238 [Gymnopilus dilepis]